MNTNRITPEHQRELDSLFLWLIERGREFLVKHAQFISDDWKQRMSAALDAKQLYLFSNRVREVLVENHKPNTGFNTTPFWSMIDAIGDYELAQNNQRWRYVSDEQRGRYIQWARECALEALGEKHECNVATA